MFDAISEDGIKDNIFYVDCRESERISAFTSFIKSNETNINADGSTHINWGTKTRKNLDYYGIVSNKSLNVGDFVFKQNDKSICFEYKTARDLQDSMVDKRLDNQTNDLVKSNYTAKFLVIETKEVLPFRLQNKLLKPQLQGINLIFGDSKIDCFIQMLNAISYVINTNLELTFNEKEHNSAYNSLRGLNSCSNTTAKKIIRAYPNITSVKDVSNITIDHLVEIKGLGNTTAKRIVNEINGDFS